MKEHIKPENFPLILDEPLPSPKMVRRLERIRERGINRSKDYYLKI